jgi:hypothetical protein
MISVRLSEDEYCALLRLRSEVGARSLSDLTRDAMRALLNGQTREDILGSSMEEFRAQINNLDRKIEELTARLRPHNPDRKVECDVDDVRIL